MPRRKKNASRSRQRTPSHQKAEKQLSESQKKKDKKRGEKHHASASSRSHSNKKPSLSNRDTPKKARFDHRLIGQKIEGKLERHAKGFGFLIPDSAEFPNVYLAEEQLLECLNRDRIVVKITETFQNGEKFRGQIVQILSHEQKEFLGALRTHKGGALVIPSDPRDAHHIFRINPEEIAQHKLKNGDYILARIEEFPAKTQGRVSVVEQVEQIDSPSSDTLRILVESSWPRIYSAAATQTAAEVAKDWQSHFPREAKDLRKLPFVTIDGADARVYL